jgi:hypothetical protein
MLLDAIDTGEGYDASDMRKYVEAARRIVQSPNAFNGGIDTLAIENFVMNFDVLKSADVDTERGKLINRAIDEILAGKEGEEVTADAWELLMLLHRVSSESVLYGAAIMFELLKGGAR